MDTRSKNADRVKKHNRFVAFLLNRKIRVVVFSITCVLASLVSLLTVKCNELITEYPYYSYGGNVGLVDYIESENFYYDRLNIYEGLCITSSFYLRNLDDRGNFTLSESAFLEFTKEMKNSYALEIKKDENGRIYAESDKWDFYVAFGDNYLTNIDYDFGDGKLDMLELENKIKSKYQYYSIRTANNVFTDLEVQYNEEEVYYSWVFNDGYEENYEYYDRSVLPLGDSGYDNLGRYIFEYYGDTEIIFYDLTKKAENFEGLTTYEIKNEQFYPEKSKSSNEIILTTYDDESFSGYKFTHYDDTDISLFFAPKASVLADITAEFEGIQKQYKTVFPQLIGCIFLLVCGCIYLAVVCGYDANYKHKWRKTVAFGRWYNEILFGAGFFLVAAFFYNIEFGNEIVKYYFTENEKYIQWANLSITAVLFGLCAGFALAVVGKFKTKSFIKDFAIYRLARRFVIFVKEHIVDTRLFTLFNQKTVGQKLYTITWIFVVWTLATAGVLFMNIFFWDFYLLLSLIWAFIYLIYAVWYAVTLFKGFGDIHKLSGQIEQISRGEAVKDDINELSLAHVDSQRLQGISENIKETVEKQVQSERMKIELVTNVSHDLKTPLTSIISYIDLLKQEDIPDAARDYVTILDAKSQKLKDIVSDVFSLAKATSGIDVELKDIDGVILLRQVLADNQDKIIASGKSVVTEIDCDSALITADGNKLYRVFQNLIDNALNYSLDGTRIFVTLKSFDGGMELMVKNTASYEMNFTPEEITERFARGDKSRTDGGNGLGLSIAKTFTEACGGKFIIQLDGDVFKATVEMPLRQEPQE